MGVVSGVLENSRIGRGLRLSIGQEVAISRAVWPGVCHTRPVATEIKAIWLKVIHRSLNKATSRLARSGHGPISLVRHRGRKSGKIYETPIMVAAVEGGFICELT